MAEKIYSDTIASAIKTFLTEDDWHFSFDENKGIFKFNLSLKSKLKKISYLINVHDDEYIVYAVSPIGADEDDEKMMAAMAEFVCRANYGMRNGNFELDMRDGEIRFKSFVDCDGITPAAKVVKNSIYCPAAMFERYAPGIIDIIFNDADAKEAVDKCERSTAKRLRSLLDSADAGTTMEALFAHLGVSTEGSSGSAAEGNAEDETEEDELTDLSDLFEDNNGGED